MKKYILSGIALLTLMLPSCKEDNLDIPRKGTVTSEMFYSDPENAENAATYVYHAGQYGHVLGTGWSDNDWVWHGAIWLLTEACSDDIYFASGHKDDHIMGLEMNEFRETFKSTNPIISRSYKSLYNIIRACNLLLDAYHIDMVTDNPELNKVVNRSVAEAKVMRAYCHFVLGTYWGTPPIVKSVLAGGDDIPQASSQKEIFDFCIADLEEAKDYLPSKANKEDANLCIRFTKEFALALKGKVEIFNKDYEAAKKSLKAVIDSELYDLVPGSEMKNLYHKAGDGSVEKVFEFNYIDNPGNIDEFTGPTNYHVTLAIGWRYVASMPNNIKTNGWGSMNPSKSFAEALIANDGEDSDRRKAWIVTYKEMLYGSDIIKFDPVAFDTTEELRQIRPLKRGVVKEGVYGNAGYWQYKRIGLISDETSFHTDCTDNNYVIMRYAEVLLLYAEACAMTSDGDGSGLAALNKVQSRAGSKTISDKLTMEAVKNEKRFEMFLDGCRFPDLVRWGDAAEVLKDQGKEIPTFVDLNKVEGTKITLESKMRTDLIWDSYNTVYGFKTNKNELMPFPFEALQVNKSLKQNPGWE